MEKEKKRILWVTGDWFMAHDIVLVPLVSQIADIHWVILFPKYNQRFKESDFDEIRNNHPNLNITFLYSKYRRRYPQNIQLFNKISTIQKKEKPDIVHLDFGVDDPWSLPMMFSLPKKKTIVVLHQGKVHELFKHKWLYVLLRKITFSRFCYVKMFSKSQAGIFKTLFPKNRVFEFSLPLIDFGNSKISRPSLGDVIFMSFGTLNYGKSIETLIDAACILHERGIKGFKVSINGSCKDWSWYQKRIKYPEIFETNIRMIDNREIPDLFNGSHYLVQPYRIVTQSGPMKIAFNYNLPVICSNLSGFTDEVVDDVNGYTFECGNAESLAIIMQLLIEKHQTNYKGLLMRMKKYTEDHYSSDRLVNQYQSMFNEIIGNNINI